MADKTVQTLLVEIQRLLGQQAGVSTQIYSQDLLVGMMTDAYELLYKKRWWKRYMTFGTFTLTGIDGYTTLPVNSLFSTLDDVKSVFYETSDVPLTAWSMERNPVSLTGTRPIAYLGDVTNIIKIVPVTATGNITILGKTNPLPSLVNLTTVIPFDSLAIKFMVCWFYAVDDGANPAAVDKFKGLFDERMKELATADVQAPISISGRSGLIQDRWEEWQ